MLEKFDWDEDAATASSSFFVGWVKVRVKGRSVVDLYVLGIDKLRVGVGGVNDLTDSLCAPTEYPPTIGYTIDHLSESVARGEVQMGTVGVVGEGYTHPTVAPHHWVATTVGEPFGHKGYGVAVGGARRANYQGVERGVGGQASERAHVAQCNAQRLDAFGVVGA